MPKVYLSLGSNIDRERHIQGAIADLQHTFGPIEVSSTYETAAVGFEGDDFYNLVVALESALPPDEISKLLGEIEVRHGRTKESRKFAARTLDIDMLLYGDACLEMGKLRLPRDEITHYAFMLEPLAEIAGEMMHPVLHQSFAALWAAFDKTDLKQHRINRG